MNNFLKIFQLRKSQLDFNKISKRDHFEEFYYLKILDKKFILI